MNGRLIRFRVRGYKALEDCAVSLHPTLTLLVGGNGTGKTTFLDALQLVADLARGVPNPLTGDARGSLGVSTIPLIDLITTWIQPRQVEFELQFSVGRREFLYRLVLVPDGLRLRVDQEHLSEAGQTSGFEQLILRDASGARIRRERGKRAELVAVGAGPEQAVLSYGRDAIAYPDVHEAWRFVAGISMLRLTPVLMRSPAQPLEPGQMPDLYGRDLRSRLQALQTASPDSVPAFLDWMTRLVGWDQLRTPVRNGLVEPTFRERGRDLPVQLVNASDGTTVHAYLASLAVDPPASLSVLLLDDSGLPYLPESANLLGDLVLALSAVRQTVLVSHSTDVVQVSGNKDKIRTFLRAPGGATRVAPLPDDAPDLDADIALRGVGPVAFDSVRPMPETTE